MKRSFTLVSTMITIVIMAILMVVVITGGFGTFSSTGRSSPRPDGKGETVLGLTKLAAQDDVCRSNLGQARAAIAVAQTAGEDSNPPSLADIKLPAKMKRCNVGGEDYIYDPASAQIKCPHPGHEKF